MSNRIITTNPNTLAVKAIQPETWLEWERRIKQNQIKKRAAQMGADRAMLNQFTEMLDDEIKRIDILV